MTHAMRPSTLLTLALGSVFEILQRGALPAQTGDLVDAVFGPASDRGALVISGANGIVGAGKTMQLASRLHPYDIPIAALDFPGSPDGIGQQYAGLKRAFGNEQAAAIMGRVTRLNYDGTHLPPGLAAMKPRFLLEAVPEVLEIKKAHYEIFRAAYPEIEIRSVTSGFPQSELGVGIAHPAFPHQINKVWEVVEPEPSAVSQLLWALGMIPMTVTDNWSFVLDVLFCGITLAALRFHEAGNMPVWKVDKYVRRLAGPNPLRAHDAIGAAGANFLTWSCLHHLSRHYGPLFEPARSLVERKDTGQNWYPLNHFRPLVNWTLEGAEHDEFETWILGPLFQMTSLLLHEKRSHLAQMNAIGELCAQFSPGVLAALRRRGPEAAIATVEAYHRLHPEAAGSAWHPEAFQLLSSPEGQQLYVNAEHDGEVGVVSISRESYNADVDAELNRALDWLKAAKIDRVILTGDFHLATQMVGADTSEFYPALEDAEKGVAISKAWSLTARRLHDEFKMSVGLVNGKRCLGGFLELMAHCRYVVAVDDAQLGLPEVTLPVVPGMEGCHWILRKTDRGRWPEVFRLLLEGRPVKAADAVGWLIDFAGPLEDALGMAWRIARGEAGPKERPLVADGLKDVEKAVGQLSPSGSPLMEAGRKAILDTVRESCRVSLAEALEVQARHSGAFMTSRECGRGMIGTAYRKTVKV